MRSARSLIWSVMFADDTVISVVRGGSMLWRDEEPKLLEARQKADMFKYIGNGLLTLGNLKLSYRVDNRLCVTAQAARVRLTQNTQGILDLFQPFQFSVLPNFHPHANREATGEAGETATWTKIN